MKVYVNDIVVFSHILKKHIEHLHIIFQILNSYCISLFSKKFYLSYLTVALLNQKIDAFKLFTVTDKLKTIMKLKFLYTLKMLEIYLSLTE